MNRGYIKGFIEKRCSNSRFRKPISRTMGHNLPGFFSKFKSNHVKKNFPNLLRPKELNIKIERAAGAGAAKAILLTPLFTPQNYRSRISKLAPKPEVDHFKNYVQAAHAEAKLACQRLVGNEIRVRNSVMNRLKCGVKCYEQIISNEQKQAKLNSGPTLEKTLPEVTNEIIDKTIDEEFNGMQNDSATILENFLSFETPKKFSQMNFSSLFSEKSSTEISRNLTLSKSLWHINGISNLSLSSSNAFSSINFKPPSEIFSLQRILYSHKNSCKTPSFLSLTLFSDTRDIMSFQSTEPSSQLTSPRFSAPIITPLMAHGGKYSWRGQDNWSLLPNLAYSNYTGRGIEDSELGEQQEIIKWHPRKRAHFQGRRINVIGVNDINAVVKRSKTSHNSYKFPEMHLQEENDLSQINSLHNSRHFNRIDKSILRQFLETDDNISDFTDLNDPITTPSFDINHGQMQMRRSRALEESNSVRDSQYFNRYFNSMFNSNY